MYEREVNVNAATVNVEAPHSKEVADLIHTVEHKSLNNWAEHCSECMMPDCFATCAFYTPREDLKCARFRSGIVPVLGAENPHAFYVEFGMWGKLESQGSPYLVKTKTAERIEWLDARISKFIAKLPLSYGLKRSLISKYYGLKNRLNKLLRARLIAEGDLLFLSLINAGDSSQELKLAIKNESLDLTQFQRVLEVSPGRTTHSIAVEEIKKLVNLEKKFHVSIEPIGSVGSGVVIEFADFCSGANKTDQAQKASGKLKCLVWDLDNTLWKGVLIEDGEERLVPNKEIISFIKETDQKGILHSVASKNNFDDAMSYLKKLEIDEYFLYPQISWNPKSAAIREIKRKLNIGFEAIAFVDDQPFEREEVSSVLPLIEVFDPFKFAELTNSERVNVSVTEDSRNRRNLYKGQIAREDSYEGSEFVDYGDFLRECSIKIAIRPLTRETLLRAYELSQRTNQMNYSGNRYTQKNLKAFMTDDNYVPVIISCSDKFGEYGIVGMCIIDEVQKTVTDLMFSCRIQSKKIDYTFLAYLFTLYGQDLLLRYLPTGKNAVSARVFEELGLETVKREDGATYMKANVGADYTSYNIEISDEAFNK